MRLSLTTSSFGIIDYHHQQSTIMPSLLSDSSASAKVSDSTSLLLPSYSSSSEQDNKATIDRSNNTDADTTNTADTDSSSNSNNNTMLASIQAQFTRVVSLDQDTFSGNVNNDLDAPPVQQTPEAGALAFEAAASSSVAGVDEGRDDNDNVIPPPPIHYVTTPVEGSTNFLMMDAKFSPIVWRSINDLDRRGCGSGNHCHNDSSSNAIGTEVIAAASHSKTMHDTNTTTAKDELPTIPSPPPIRHSSEQSEGPPKIPTLGDDDDEETTSTTATVHANNNNGGNDKDDDEEVASYMIKSPPLAPRKRSLGYDDSPHPFNGSSSIFFVEERLPSKIYWIPPRRPTKKSRLFLYTHPEDDKAAQDPKVENKELMLDEHQYLEPEKKELEDDHHCDEEGSVATFSVSSSTGFSIATPRSSYSPTFSIYSTSAIDDSSSAAAITTTTTTASSTAQHTLNGRIVSIPTGMRVKDFMASELQNENVPATANLFFTPPRRPDDQAACL